MDSLTPQKKLLHQRISFHCAMEHQHLADSSAVTVGYEAAVCRTEPLWWSLNRVGCLQAFMFVSWAENLRYHRVVKDPSENRTPSPPLPEFPAFCSLGSIFCHCEASRWDCNFLVVDGRNSFAAHCFNVRRMQNCSRV